MKIALVVLAMLLVLTSQQKHQQSKPFWMLPNLGAIDPPNEFRSYSMGSKAFGRFQSNKHENCDKHQQEIYPDIQSRRLSQYPAQQRFFFNPFSFLAAQTTAITSTTTSLTTVTSTVTVAVITSCIPAKQFEFSTPCHGLRRRRDAADFSELLDDGDYGKLVAPLPSDKPFSPRWALTEREPEIVSSKADTFEDYSRTSGRIVNVYVKTEASTVTSYLLNSTTITKTIKLVADPQEGPGVLQCLPNGFLVCSP